MGKIVRLGVILLLLTAITGLILGVVYQVTSGPIAQTQHNQKMSALAATLPGATDFEAVDLVGDGSVITAINKGTAGGELVGYNFSVSPRGYAGPISLIVGISKEGTVRGAQILIHSETPGLGARASEPAFIDQFKDRSVASFRVVKSGASDPQDIQAISGATITSAAVAQGVNQAIEYFNAHFSGNKSGAPSSPSVQTNTGAAEAQERITEKGVDIPLKETSGDIRKLEAFQDESKQTTGYSFRVTPRGFNDVLEMQVHITSDGTVRDVRILNHSETPRRWNDKKEAPFLKQFNDKKSDRFSITTGTPANDQQIQAVSGATITSNAVLSGVNQAIAYFNTHLAGGKAQ